MPGEPSRWVFLPSGGLSKVVACYSSKAAVTAPARGMLRGELGHPAVPGCIPFTPQFLCGKSFGLA